MRAAYPGHGMPNFTVAGSCSASNLGMEYAELNPPRGRLGEAFFRLLVDKRLPSGSQLRGLRLRRRPGQTVLCQLQECVLRSKAMGRDIEQDDGESGIAA